jgi:hypothetical protein
MTNKITYTLIGILIGASAIYLMKNKEYQIQPETQTLDFDDPFFYEKSSFKVTQ